MFVTRFPSTGNLQDRSRVSLLARVSGLIAWLFLALAPSTSFLSTTIVVSTTLVVSTTRTDKLANVVL